MSELSAVEQYEIKSGRAILLTDALAQIQAALPFVVHYATYPARTEVIDGQPIFLPASVKFVFDNDRGLRISFGDELPTITRLDNIDSVRDLIEREYAAQNTGDRPFTIPVE